MALRRVRIGGRRWLVRPNFTAGSGGGTPTPTPTPTPSPTPPADWDAVRPYAAVDRGYYNPGSAPLPAPFAQSFHFAQRGDIPAGSYPCLFNGGTQIPTQVDLVREAYPDGSWSCGGLTAFAPDALAANGSAGDGVTYQIKPVVGSPPSTPKFSLATWAAANDMRITFRTNLANQADDTANFEFKVSDCIASGIVQGVGTGSGYPLYSYRVTRSGPVCMGWMFEGYMRRKSDGAYHTQLKCRLFVQALTLTDMLIHGVLRMPNAVDTQQVNPLQTVGPVKGADFAPMTGTAELSNNGSVLHRWGGPTDFRAVSFPATVKDVKNNQIVATVDTVANQIVFPDAGNQRPRNSVGYVFTSTGTLPGGMTAGQVYWTTVDFYGQRVYLDNTRAFARGAGSTMHTWVAGATPIANNFFNSYVVGTVGNYRLQQRWMPQNAGTFGSTAPSGTTTQVNGTVTLVPMNPVISSQGAGTLSAYPVVHVFTQCEARLVDETTAGRIWTGSGPNPLVNNVIDLPYHIRYARAFPPYDLTVTTVNADDFIAKWGNGHSVGEPSFQSQIDNFGDNPGTNLVGWLNYTNTCAMLAQRNVTIQKQARSEALRWADHWTCAEDPRSGMPIVGQNGLGNVPGTAYPGLGPSMTDFYFAGVPEVIGAGKYTGIGSLVQNVNYYDAKYRRIVDGSHLPATWVWQYHSTGDEAYLDMGVDLAVAVGLCQADDGIGRTWTYNGRKYCCTAAIFNQIRGMGWSIRCIDTIYCVLPANHPCRALITDIYNDTQDAAVAAIDWTKNNDPLSYNLGVMRWPLGGSGTQHFFASICLLSAAQASRNAWRTGTGFRAMCDHVAGRYFLPIFDDAGPGNAGLASWNESTMLGDCEVRSVTPGDVLTLKPVAYRFNKPVGVASATYTVPAGATVASVAQDLVSLINGNAAFQAWGIRARYEDGAFFNTRMPDLLFDETRYWTDGCFEYASSGTGTLVLRAAVVFKWSPNGATLTSKRKPMFASIADVLEFNCGTGWPKGRTIQLAQAGSGTGGAGNAGLPFNVAGWFPWGTVDYFIFVRMAVAMLVEAGIQGPAAQGTGSTTAQISDAIEQRFRTSHNGPPKWSGIVTGQIGAGPRTYPNFNIRTWSAQAQWPSTG